jgi:type IV secretory pathway VirJ component
MDVKFNAELDVDSPCLCGIFYAGGGGWRLHDKKFGLLKLFHLKK